MATGIHRESARIYDFAARRSLAPRGPAAEPAAPAPFECDGWYHEAAMREEERARAAARPAGTLLAFAPPSGTA